MTTSDFAQHLASWREATAAHVVIEEEKGGYEVRTATLLRDRAPLIERVSAICGIALIAVALTGILAAKEHALPVLGGNPMTPAAIILSGGVAFLWISIRGMRYRVKFDLEQRQMHLRVCNLLASCRVLRTLCFDEIGSAFVKRPARRGQTAKLFVRVGDSDDVMEIAQGTEAELKQLHDRLSRDLPARVEIPAPRASTPSLRKEQLATAA